MPTPTHLARGELLPGLLERLDESLGHHAGAKLIRLHTDHVGFTVGVLDLPGGVHPVDVVLGVSADPDWEGAGLVADATAWSTDPAADRDPTRVRLLHVVDRSGASASRLRPLTGDGPVLSPTEPEGHVDDACRRILGLPTAAPPSCPAAWQAVAWLSQIHAAALLHPARRWGWPALTACHPAAADLGPSPTPAELITDGRRMAATTWDEVRLAVAGGHQRVGEVSAEVAAWMDAGMFARWLFAQHADPRDVVADLVHLVGEGELSRVAEVIAAWGVDPRGL